jgi:hypothetical protein
VGGDDVHAGILAGSSSSRNVLDVGIYCNHEKTNEAFRNPVPNASP